jgi:type I restriction enzyme R subunit
MAVWPTDTLACALYKRALDKYLPAEYPVPVYTKNAADTIERPLVAEVQIEETNEKTVRKEFPKADRLPKIFIVTDKLLTGYDAPILYAMYLDKPMRDHVLLQAVARVNELNKALAFDSRDVTGVIEDLDLLLVRFGELMETTGKQYLDLAGGGPGGNDQKLDRLLYETFLDQEERQRFVEFFKEVETLYEILSPSAELRRYVDEYVCFSEALLEKPLVFQNYVIVHELLHLRVPNHGKLFKSLLSVYLPGWRHSVEDERR